MGAIFALVGNIHAIALRDARCARRATVP